MKSHYKIVVVLAAMLLVVSGYKKIEITKTKQQSTVEPFSKAVWIGPVAVASKPVNTYYAFRKAFELQSKPTSAPLRITADARYILWVNGEFVGRGPARCFPWHQSYDEYNLAEKLKAGTNWLSILVYQFGIPNSVATVTGQTGLIIEGQANLSSRTVIPMNTDESWEMRDADWFSPIPASFIYGLFSFQERYDATRELAGWHIGRDTGQWQKSIKIASATNGLWTNFEPRNLKPIRETIIQPASLVAVFTGKNQVDYLTVNDLGLLWKGETQEFTSTTPTISSDGWVTVRASQDNFVTLLFDFGQVYTSYPLIEILDAKGGEVFDSGYALALSNNHLPDVPNGACDRFIAAKGKSSWQAFMTRGYRYHAVKVRASGPVTMRVAAVQTRYDVEMRGKFECSDTGLTKVWEISNRTLRANMLDAFVDNNWREQTQWLADGTVSALGAFVTYGDTTLWRRLLLQTGQSSQQFSNGAVSSMPACDSNHQREYMPLTDQALTWPVSLEQYYLVTADDMLLREILPYLRSFVLRFVDSGITSDNLFVQPPGATVFLDWVDRPWNKKPYNLTLNLMALRTLRSSAKIAELCGDNNLAGYCHRRNLEMSNAIAEHFWSEKQLGWCENIEPSETIKQKIKNSGAGRIDDPWQEINVNIAKTNGYSTTPTFCTRHANALAILLKLGTQKQQADAADIVVRAFEPNQNLINNGMSPLWIERIFGSLFEAGRDEDAVRLLQASYGMWAINGASYWGEGFGSSDYPQACGASVNWLLTSYILGIRPTKPGFSEVVFDPRPGKLTWAKGIVPTPYGDIHIEWKRDKHGRIKEHIDTPRGVKLIKLNSAQK
ncbi:MAG: hypothetical protein A2Y12_00065 [Planctomycetes bacterium GWF2_42_9]|nr:MAG: hypothetical protein A2Y12_00065 [Planctomycetes bacterium GWF2_42_9]